MSATAMKGKELPIVLGGFILLMVISTVVMSLFGASENNTTPPPPPAVEPVLSIFALLDEALKSELRLQPLQWLHAVSGAIFGFVAIANGEFVFKWLIIFGVFAMAMLLALSEVNAILGSAYPPILAQIIAFEAGLACAYASWCGISGVMLGIGAGLGVWLAHQVQGLFVVLGYTQFGTHVWLVVVWYTLLILLGMGVMMKKKYMTVLALLSSAFGGALMTASLLWFVTLAVKHYHSIPGASLCTPHMGPWVNFLVLLFTSWDVEDVGLFAESSEVNIFGTPFPVDRLIGCGLWLVLFIGGSVHQYKVAKLQAELNPVESEVSRSWSRSSWGSFGREVTDSLKQPMLEQSELSA